MKHLIVLLIAVLLSGGIIAQTWERFFGEPNKKEGGTDLIECYDRGYLLGTGSNETTYSWIIITDVNGELLWDKRFSWTNKVVGINKVDQNTSGEISVTGLVWWGGGKQWPMTVKLDECGNQQWCKVFIDEEYEHGVFTDALLLENGDVVALAHFSSPQNIDQIFLY